MKKLKVKLNAIRHLIFILVVATSTLSKAEYPSPEQNHDLKNQIAKDTDREIPSSDLFTFAADGNTWFRALGTNDFYHGFGYWIQGRSEISPDPHYKVNVRSIFYSGSSSEGYASPTGFYNLIGLSGVWPKPILGATIIARVIDIERQTLANGLLIQDREMNGFLLTLDYGEHAISFVGDSTGGLVTNDDTINAEVSLWKGILRLGGIFFTEGVTPVAGDKFYRAPDYYFASNHRWESINYRAEASIRNRAAAGLLALGTEYSSDKVKLNFEVQGRRYTPGFGKDFVGEINQQYVSYDQYDKDFTNAMNVFVYSDDGWVEGTKLNLSYSWSKDFRTYIQSEIGRFDFQKTTDVDYGFYRLGAMLYPIEGRTDGLEIFVSNKVLTESYSRPPQNVARENVPLFKMVNFAGVEAHFRF